ncbi:DUF1236 domain-containing protein [Phenylobacterium montanum]|uniref:DUF1236 domain-containing protein n=1 Tax=Phenylobacterium montanum TaxID=2823693 RepID=A0A975IW37_9CAUL|nr:DUF1236 domain-containing protein [Caulobacter sp. S6]QUD89415.1 DUF1236 domain-containing protein [Caulobacter sp. S6]
MKRFILAASAASLLLASAPAFAQTTTTDSQANPDGSTTTTQTTVTKKGSTGAGVGVAGGAVAGAVVGGPIGAAVGAVAGGIAGATVDPPKEVKTYVRTQRAAPVDYDGPVALGDTLPDSVTTYDVPRYERYHWTYIHGQKLLIDERTHKIVSIVNDE